MFTQTVMTHTLQLGTQSAYHNQPKRFFKYCTNTCDNEVQFLLAYDLHGNRQYVFSNVFKSMSY